MKGLTLCSTSHYVLTSAAASALLNSKKPERGAMALKNTFCPLNPAHFPICPHVWERTDSGWACGTPLEGTALSAAGLKNPGMTSDLCCSVNVKVKKKEKEKKKETVQQKRFNLRAN